MSKRIDKKKQKRQIENVSAAVTAAPALESLKEQTDFYIQYQNEEYLEQDIVNKIREKCKAEGCELSVFEKLSVYLKPEDKKAYYTCGEVSGAVEL